MNDFSQGSVKKRIIEQAIPLTLAQIVQMLYNLVDRIYIGHMPDIGELALTGVGITFPITVLIMAFTLSLDDFVISYFTQGNGFQTLPIRIYNMTKKVVTPKMYALSTIIFFVILTLLLISNLTDKEDNKQEKARR